MMSATACEQEMEEEEMEMGSLLLRNFDHFFQSYKDALMELQSSKVSYSSESKRCETLDTSVKELQKDNEHLRRLYTETLFKFTNQMKFHSESQSLKEELEKLNSRLLHLEQEHNMTVETLKQENEAKMHALEEQLSCSLAQRARDEAIIKKLQLELDAHETHIDILVTKLEQVTADVHSQYHNEIQELKDLILVTKEEKKGLDRKLQTAENEIKILKTKQSEQQMDSMSVQHVDTLKQKIMKLRKENETLKRKLVNFELDSA